MLCCNYENHGSSVESVTTRMNSQLWMGFRAHHRVRYWREVKEEKTEDSVKAAGHGYSGSSSSSRKSSIRSSREQVAC
jgi:hypothetical protein